MTELPRVRPRVSASRTRWRKVLVSLAALFVLAAAPLSAASGRVSTMTSAPRIALQLLSRDNQQGQIVSVAADGRGRIRQLIPGMHNWLGCQSANGRKMLYSSDQEAPHENFLYVANADGTDPKKITEDQVGYSCPFSERWLLLSKPGGALGAVTLIRHDLQTGAEKELVSVDRGSVSPDGSKLLFVGGLDFTPVQGHVRPSGNETLEVIELNTLNRHRLAGPLPQGKSFRFYCSHCIDGWSRDSKRVAYTVGPPYYQPQNGPISARLRAQPYAVYVQRVAGGAARRVLGFSGGPPSISWSADGRRLLVCTESRARPFQAAELACDGASFTRPGSKGRYVTPTVAGKLLLVDLAHRSVRHVVSGKKLLFAQFAPTGQTFAYATTAAAYLTRPGGARRPLSPATKPNWPGSQWIGWSPDGRYIGLGNSASLGLAVLNVHTGRVRFLVKDTSSFLIWGATWWR